MTTQSVKGRPISLSWSIVLSCSRLARVAIPSSASMTLLGSEPRRAIRGSVKKG